MEMSSRLAFAFLTLILLLVLTLSSCSVVNPGHRGVRVTMGKVSPDAAGEGVALHLPFVTSINEVSIQQQTVPGEAPCFSKDLQTVTVKYALLYRLPEAKVVQLYQDYRGDPFESLVEPRLQEALKQVTAVHNAEELVQKRDLIRADSLTKLRSLVGDVINIVDLSIVNIDLSDQLEHAIEQKMVRQQEALAKTFELDKEKTQAEITIVQAEAEAKGISIKAEALLKSPNVIDLEIIKKWDGRSPNTIVVGEGGGAKTILPIGTDATRPAKTP